MNDYISTGDLDAVFGNGPLADRELEAVRLRFAAVHAEFATLPAPTPRPDLAVLFGDEPASDTVLMRPPARPASRRASRRTSRAGLRYRLAAVAATLTAVAGITTGLAAAQVLPTPVQHFVDDAFDHIGIHLRTDSDSTPHTPAPRHTPATAATHSPGTAGTATTPDHAAGGSTLVPTTVTIPPVPNTVATPAPATLPPVTLPPITLLQTGLPPLTLPPVTLPHLPPLFP